MSEKANQAHAVQASHGPCECTNSQRFGESGLGGAAFEVMRVGQRPRSISKLCGRDVTVPRMFKPIAVGNNTRSVSEGVQSDSLNALS